MVLRRYVRYTPDLAGDSTFCAIMRGKLSFTLVMKDLLDGTRF